LKASDFSKNSLKEEANEKAYVAFEKNIKAQVRVEAEETKRGKSVINVNCFKFILIIHVRNL